METSCPNETWLSAYHDGELSETQQREIAAHVARCHVCARELRELSRLSRLFETNTTTTLLQRPTLSEASIERMHASVSDLMAERSLLRFTLRLSGIAAALLVAAGVWLVQARPRPLTPSDSQQTVMGSNLTGPSLIWEQEALSAQVRPQQVLYDLSNAYASASRNVETAQWIVSGLSVESDSGADRAPSTGTR